MAFTDNFTDTDGVNLESHTPSGGTSWTRIDGVAGAASILSNAVEQNSGTNTAYKCAPAQGADSYAQTVSVLATNWAGFVGIRITDSNNFIGYRGNGATWEVYKRVSGTFTLIGSWAGTPAVSDVAYLEGSGSSVTLKVNGTTRVGPLTETAHQTVDGQGFIVRANTAATWDDFSSAAVTGGSTPGAVFYFHLTQQGIA